MIWKQWLSLLVAAMLTLSSFFQPGGGMPAEPTDPGDAPGLFETEPTPVAAPDLPGYFDPAADAAALTPCSFRIAPEEVWLLPGDSAALMVEAEPLLFTDEQPNAPDAIAEVPAAAAEPETEAPAEDEAADAPQPDAEAAPDAEPPAGEPFAEAAVEAPAAATAEPAQIDLQAESEDGEEPPTEVAALPNVPADDTDVIEDEPELPAAEGVLNCAFDPDLLEWRSGNEAIATVDQNGVVTAVSLGETVISVYLPDREQTAACTVAVVETLPASTMQKANAMFYGRVAISPNTSWNSRPTHYPAPLSSGYIVNLDVYQCNKNGSYTGRGGDVSGRVTWYSSNTKVATVDQYGRVTAVGEGTATISIKSNFFINLITVYNPVRVTVYKSESGKAIVKSWVTQYRCTDKRGGHSCGEKNPISPGTELQIYGKAGGYYYASIAGQGARYFMWAAHINKQSDTTGVRICEQGSLADTRRHWILLEGETLTLRLKGGGSCSWKTFSGSSTVVSVNGQSAVNAASVAVRADHQGSEFIIANQSGKIDVIHVSVVAPYPTAKAASTVSWCGQYRCSHAKCTISDHGVKNVPPGKGLTVYGESGGFYYAKVNGESDCWFMWKSNVSVNWGSWEKKCSLQNRNVSGGAYAPQGFAVDDDYAYSFETRIKNGTHQHRLFRYDLDGGELVQMLPETQIDLLHANDAAVVTFRENGKDQKYLFVAKSFENEDCSLVKLAIDDDAREYRFVAEYPIRILVSGISFVSGGGNQPAVFLLKSGYSFYEVSVSSNNDEITLPSKAKVTISSNFKSSRYPNISTHQGMHYEPSNDRLYLPFFAHKDFKDKFTSVIRCYNNISTATGTKNEDVVYEFTQSPYFEIEGIGFRSGRSDRYLWFNTFESGTNGGIYKDKSILK